MTCHCLPRAMFQPVDSDDFEYVTAYSYNLQGQMAKSTTTHTGGSVVGGVGNSSTIYEYDSAGNRVASTTTKVNSFGNNTTTRIEYLTDSQNPTGYSQVLTETEFEVDANGQVGAPIKQTVYTIGHDQISQTVYDDWNSVTEVWSLKSEVWFGTDGHGSVRVLYNAAVAVATSVTGHKQLYHFDAYGNLTNVTMVGTPMTVYLYNGEAFDFNIGKMYSRARWYDPQTGTFISLDPFYGNSSDPQSFHKYAYVHSDPVNGIDPTGMYMQSLWARVKSDSANLAAFASIQARLIGYHMMSAARIYMNLGTGVGGITGKVLNYSWLVGSVSTFWAGLSAINGLRYMKSKAAEPFAQAAERLRNHLKATQTTASGKDQAIRIANAIEQTYERNSRFHFRAVDPFNLAEVSLQKGIFCAEWATAFRNTALYEIRRSQSAHFSVERQYSEVVGDPEGRVHSWIKITPLNGGKPIYVDDGFTNRLFVHERPPIPGGYSFTNTLDHVQDPAWYPPPIYDSQGNWINDESLNPWNIN